MAHAAGTRLGPYEILSAVGAGGMGEVYKARDTRLDRTVAIKVLAAHLASSPDLRERFDREARVVSSLNHPNICVIHDVGHDRGTDFLVMEFLDGETLAARLERGPLPLAEVLRYGVQIADALDRAHRQGIVHRDLKPGNVMLTKSGVKLLDFGLAKLAAGTQSGSGSVFTTAGPTVEQGLTAQGTILGTFQYMAPEQLEGGDADARTDIFAFGTLLYEMATGRKAFDGKTHASLIGAILRDQPPPIASVQALAPASLDGLVARCLAKDPEERWQSAHDIASQLRWIEQSGSHPAETSTVKRRRPAREYVAWAIALVGLLAAAALAVRSLRPDTPAPLVRFRIAESELAPFGRSPNAPFPAISPDGRHLAFIAGQSDGVMLFVRSLESLETRALAGTEGAGLPFWSADSRFAGFFANGAIKKVDVAAGGVQTICPTAGFEGAAWNADGMILFSKGLGGLFRVAAGGGEPVPVTTLEAASGTTSHRWPAFLPDGRHFLFVAQPGNDVYYGSLDGGAPKRVLRSDSRAIYASGYVLFGRDGTLLAQPFDPTRGDATGEAVPIAQDVRMNSASGRATYTVSSGGVLVYRQGNLSGLSEIVWVDNAGKPLETVLADGDYRGIALSPSGRHVAFHRHESSGGGTVWIKDLARGTITPLTTHPSHNAWPAWAPDGERIAFLSDRAGTNDIYVRAASGTGDDQLLHKSDVNETAVSWSAGPQPVIAFSVGSAPGAPGVMSSADVWVVRPDGTSKAEALLTAPFAEFQPEISPDAKWIAYASNETGRAEVYVQPYPPDGRKFPISTAGGLQPRWSRNGGELVFVALDGKVMSATIGPAPTFQVSVPRELFPSRLSSAPLSNYRAFDLSSDGRILIAQPKDTASAIDPLTVVLNWPASLPQR